MNPGRENPDHGNWSSARLDAHIESSASSPDDRSEPGVGLAVAALVLGVVGVLTCWLLVGGVTGIAAIVLGAVVLVKAHRGTARGWAAAVTGIILGALGVVAAVAFAIYYHQSLDNFMGRTADLGNCVERASHPGPSAPPRCS